MLYKFQKYTANLSKYSNSNKTHVAYPESMLTARPCTGAYVHLKFCT